VVIIDTTVWIDYLRGSQNPETLWLDRELQRQRLGLTDLILCEDCKYSGAERVRAVRADLLKFQVFETAAGPGDCGRSELPRLAPAGYTVHKTIDCSSPLLLAGRHELLHRDHDFDCFERCLVAGAACGGVNLLLHTSFTRLRFVLKLVMEIR